MCVCLSCCWLYDVVRVVSVFVVFVVGCCCFFNMLLLFGCLFSPSGVIVFS